jgi:hypothetical protein
MALVAGDPLNLLTRQNLRQTLDRPAPFLHASTNVIAYELDSYA